MLAAPINRLKDLCFAARRYGRHMILNNMGIILRNNNETAAAAKVAPAHICAGAGLTAATSAPGLGPSLPHLRRDWGSLLRHLHRTRAHPAHICTGTRRTQHYLCRRWKRRRKCSLTFLTRMFDACCIDACCVSSVRLCALPVALCAFVCVRACVRAYVCACALSVCACVSVCVHCACVRACACVSVRALIVWA